jgi:hypothetical protein
MRPFLFILFCLALPFYCKREFKPPPVHAEIPFHPEWETGELTEEVAAILRAPFSYLAHGNQSTVFVSEDGQYVLKLFRYHRTRFPLIHKIKTWKRKKDDLYTKMEKTFKAAALAATVGKPFTQVVFAHLNLTENQLPKVRIGGYLLPLDSYRFVLQKKAAPFKETLSNADPEKFKRLIASFLSLLEKRKAAGISNSDPNLGPNFGFIGEEAVEIDFGNYRQGEKEEFFVDRLESWLQKKLPKKYSQLNEAKSLYRSSGTLDRNPPL